MAKPERLRARCVSVMVSASESKVTVWVPTVAPIRLLVTWSASGAIRPRVVSSTMWVFRSIDSSRIAASVRAVPLGASAFRT